MRGKRWGYRWWGLGLLAWALATVLALLSPLAIIILILDIAAMGLMAVDWKKSGAK
ncbi:MAG: hypothetical protein ACM3ZT_08700 [Bacillota bacterium]